MKILAIDLGTRFGYCFKNGNDENFGTGVCIDLTDWGKQFKELLDLWKPDIVVLSQTNNFGFWNATRAMLMKAGAAFYICGKAGIAGIELNDSSARKAVFGKGIKKKEVQKIYPDIQADALDALILARGWDILSRE
jgi:Holliday junction resolvasome RuvABC endonuclease subunit